MIPKVIHYCWFGDNPMPALNKACIETWKKYLGDYTFKLWNEENCPMNDYVKYHLEQGNWAFVSDYVRLHALYTEGGVYLDTDFEVLKPFEDLLNSNGFIAYESPNTINNAIAGSVKENRFFKMCMDYMLDRHAQGLEIEISPVVTSRIYFQGSHNIDVFPSYYFYPYNPYDWSKDVKILMSCMISENTYAIHHWAKSWHKDNSKEERACSFLKKIYNRINNILGCKK